MIDIRIKVNDGNKNMKIEMETEKFLAEIEKRLQNMLDKLED